MNAARRAAIVTGGTGALGSAVCAHFLNAGIQLGVPVHDRASRSRIQAQGDSQVYVAEADVTDPGAVDGFVRDISKRFGAVDYLINIAGGYAGGNLIEEVTTDEWDGMMGLNLRSVFLMCRSVLPIMRGRNFGRIVSITAMPALEGGARKGPYTVSKGGVITLTQTIAREVRGTGITANAIAPSIIDTDANRRSMPDADYAKWVTVEEIAAMIDYLCSDSAKSISGNIIKMYGGV